MRENPYMMKADIFSPEDGKVNTRRRNGRQGKGLKPSLCPLHNGSSFSIPTIHNQLFFLEICWSKESYNVFVPWQKMKINWHFDIWRYVNETMQSGSYLLCNENHLGIRHHLPDIYLNIGQFESYIT